MGVSDVSNILWRERLLLQLLLFKLEEEQLVVASGRGRWLAHATREVEIVIAEIKRVELDRAIRVEETAAQLGCGSCPTLRELGARAPAPWAKILGDHRIAILELTREIDASARTKRDLSGLRCGTKARADDPLLRLRASLSQIEDIDLPNAATDVQIQQAAGQAPLDATARVVQPSLVDFLE